MTHISPASAQDAAQVRPVRQDGWTPDRRRYFLEAVAEGHTVERACRIVGLSVASVYALRRRADGADFALGWRAASLLARDRIGDDLLARAIDGQLETTTRPDGSTVSRHRYDNRLAHSMLTRLDKFADSASADGSYQAARLVAGEFDQFLDLIEADRGPARAGLFLGLRAAAPAAGGGDLAAVAGLTRADRYLRTGRGLAEEVDTSDLDPAMRAGWTADQWTRAEAAGLFAFAPAQVEDEIAPGPQLPQAVFDDPPVWWCKYAKEWRTSFPPPEGFKGMQDGDFGDELYERELTEDELDAAETPLRIELAVRHVSEARERDIWFGKRRAGIPADEDAGEDAKDEPEDDGEEDETGGNACDESQPGGGGHAPDDAAGWPAGDPFAVPYNVTAADQDDLPAHLCQYGAPHSLPAPDLPPSTW